MKNYNLQQDVFAWLEAAGFERGDEAMRKTAIEGFYSEKGEAMVAVSQKDKSEVMDGLTDMEWMLQNCKYFGVSMQITIRMLGEVEGVHFLYHFLCEGNKNPITGNDNKRYQKAVSISNWSKFCKNEAEAKATVTAYYFGSHPDKPNKKIPTLYKQVGEKWVVCHEHTRKVLKSINYITVQDALKTL